jgi:hypothetical protein
MSFVHITIYIYTHVDTYIYIHVHVQLYCVYIYMHTHMLHTLIVYMIMYTIIHVALPTKNMHPY